MYSHPCYYPMPKIWSCHCHRLLTDIAATTYLVTTLRDRSLNWTEPQSNPGGEGDGRAHVQAVQRAVHELPQGGAQRGPLEQRGGQAAAHHARQDREQVGRDRPAPQRCVLYWCIALFFFFTYPGRTGPQALVGCSATIM